MISFLPNTSRSLRDKIVLLTCFTVFLTAVFIGGVNYKRITDITFNTAIQELASETKLLALKFKSGYESLKNDAFVISKTPPIADIINDLKNNQKKLKFQSNNWQKRLETIFISIMESRPYYTQIRFIGIKDNGRELVRVNKTNNGFERVAKENLQQKSNEKYFKSSIHLKQGEVYFSEVTYNREQDKIDKVLTPTIRLVKPIFDNKKLYGFIVINADYPKLLSKIFLDISPNKNAFIVNHAGDYLKYSSVKGVGQFQFHESYSKKPPQIITNISNSINIEGVFYNEKTIDYFTRLNIDDNNPKAFLSVIIQASKLSLLEDVHQIQLETIVLAIFLILLFLFLAFFVAYKITKPLKLITEIIKNSNNLDEQLNLPITRNDEIGELSKAFKEKTTKLLENKEKLDIILATAPDGIISIDENGVIKSLNNATKAIFGYGDELIGKPIDILIPNNQIKFSNSKYLALNLEVTGNHKNGKTLSLEARLSQAKMPDSSIFTNIFIRDVFDRKKIEQSSRLLNSIVESSIDGIMSKDLSSKITSWNKGAELIFGYTEEEMIGEDIKKIFPEDRKSEEEAIIKSIKTGVVVKDLDTVRQKKDGSQISVSATISPIFDNNGKIVGAASVTRDISERKRAKNSLSKLYNISLNNDLNHQQKIDDILKTSLEYLNLNLAIVSTVKDKEYKVIHAFPKDSIETSTTFELGNTYCYHTLNTGSLTNWVNAGESEIAGHPCYLNFKLETYIGIPIYINDKIYGTVNFTSEGKRNKVFSEQEKIYVNLVSKYISNEIERKLNFNKIKESEKFLKLITEENPDLIFVKDSDYRIVFCNESFVKMYPKEKQNKIIGYTTLEEYKQEEVEIFLEKDKEAFRNGYSETTERITFPNGEIKILLTQKIRFSNTKNEDFILCIARDVTERESLISEISTANALKSAITSSSKHLLIATDTEGLVTYFNNAAEELLGYKADEVVGKETPKLWHDINEIRKHAKKLSKELNQKIEPEFETFITKAKLYGSETNNWIFITKTGKRIPCELTATCIRDNNNNIIGFLGVIVDITEKIKVEKEKTLFLERLNKSNEELARFAYVCSHDLQEPLRMVKSFADKIESHFGEKLINDEKGSKYLNFIIDGAERAQELIRDILEYSKLGTETKELENVNLNEVINSVKTNLALNFEEKKGKLIINNIPQVMGNKTQLYQLFQNLINNALKYVEADISPIIEIGFKNKKDHYEFYVKDNGIGIDKKFHDKIFEVFKRLHTKNKYQGTGVGLSLCKKIVENHNGKIWVESDLGIGSTFYFTLQK